MARISCPFSIRVETAALAIEGLLTPRQDRVKCSYDITVKDDAIDGVSLAGSLAVRAVVALIRYPRHWGA